MLNFTLSWYVGYNMKNSFQWFSSVCFYPSITFAGFWEITGETEFKVWAKKNIWWYRYPKKTIYKLYLTCSLWLYRCTLLINGGGSQYGSNFVRTNRTFHPLSSWGLRICCRGYYNIIIKLNTQWHRSSHHTQLFCWNCKLRGCFYRFLNGLLYLAYSLSSFNLTDSPGIQSHYHPQHRPWSPWQCCPTSCSCCRSCSQQQAGRLASAGQTAGLQLGTLGKAHHTTGIKILNQPPDIGTDLLWVRPHPVM